MNLYRIPMEILIKHSCILTNILYSYYMKAERINNDARIKGLFQRFNVPAVQVESIRKWLEQFDEGDWPSALRLPFFKRIEDFTLYSKERFIGITSEIIVYDMDNDKSARTTGKSNK